MIVYDEAMRSGFRVRLSSTLYMMALFLTQDHPDHTTLKESLLLVQKVHNSIVTQNYLQLLKYHVYNPQIATDCNESIRRAENELNLFAISKRFPNDDVVSLLLLLFSCVIVTVMLLLFWVGGGGGVLAVFCNNFWENHLSCVISGCIYSQDVVTARRFFKGMLFIIHDI